MGSYIIVEYKGENTTLGERNSGIDVLSVPQPSAAIKRFKKETIWGRDGFIVDGEGAYDGVDGVVEILTRGETARAKVLDIFSTKYDSLDMFINNKTYYRTGKVVSHDLEIISDKDALHIISVAFQPFYTRLLARITEPALYKNSGDVDALPVMTLVGTRGTQISVGDYKMQMGDDTMVINSYDRTVTNHMGNSIIRDALKKAELSKYKFSNTETEDLSGVQSGKGLKYTGTSPAQRKEYRGSVVRTWGFPVAKPGGLLPSVVGATLQDIKVYERFILPKNVEEWIGGN